MCERTTMDYQGPQVAPRIQARKMHQSALLIASQALLDDALKDDDEINIEVSMDDALDAFGPNSLHQHIPHCRLQRHQECKAGTEGC